MKLKLFFTAFASLAFLLSMLSCGKNSNTTAAASDSDSIAQEEIDEQIAEEVPEVGSIDWDTVMPKIVRNLPKETVPDHFRGKIGPDSVDYETYKEPAYSKNFYSYGDMGGDTHYIFNVMAAPYSDGDNALVIVNAQAGVDGVGTLLLKTMRYNLQTGEFSDMSDKIPGVEPDAELLDFGWLSEHPDWIKQIKRDYNKYSTYDLILDNGVCKVQNSFNDNDICYYIYEDMGDDVPDWYSRLNLVYVWNGKTFELEKK